MSKKLLWLILILLNIPAVRSQNFTWQTDTTTKTGSPGNFVVIHTFVINHTTDQLRLRVIRFQNLLPQNWSSSFCVGGVNGTCYNPAMDTISMDVSAGGQEELALDFSTSQTPDEGQIGVRIENTGNNLEFYERSFIVSTFSTQLQGGDQGVNEFRLYKNYPNPFNPSTTIPFQVGGITQQRVIITVYNILGQYTRILVNEKLDPGYHTVKWDGTNNQGNTVSSGLYFLEMRTENYIFRDKMFLLR